MALGSRSAQVSLFAPDAFLTPNVREDSFYGFLASQRDRLFNGDKFADLYKPKNGRPSAPPSLLAIALLLRTYYGLSDKEAKARAEFDLRWTLVIGIPLCEASFAICTLWTPVPARLRETGLQ